MAVSPLLRAAHAAGAAGAASSNGNTPRRAPKVPFVAITGAKGGVGKTVVATNLALLLAQQGYKTLLVDLDPSCGNVDVHLRIARARSLDDVATGMCTPQEAIYEAPFGLRVLAGKSGPRRCSTPRRSWSIACLRRSNARRTASTSSCSTPAQGWVRCRCERRNARISRSPSRRRTRARSPTRMRSASCCTLADGRCRGCW
jgi:hypothetical protein